MNTKATTIVALFTCFFVFGKSQVPAKLDSSFLSIGEFWDGYLNQYQSIVASVSLPDSTLVYVAQITAGTGPSAMIKLKTDGSIDSSFGTSGVFTYQINGVSPAVKGIHYVAGKLYLSGKLGREKFVTRININGSIDATFGNFGSRTINYATPIVDITNSITFDQFNNCFIGARFTDLASSVTKLTVTKIDTNGNIALGFGTSGRADFVLPSGSVSAFSDLAIDSNQNIIAAACGSSAGNNVVLLVKFNQNGVLDNGFNSLGYKEWSFQGADTYQVATNEILTDKNKIIVAGEYLVSGILNAFVFKLKPNGEYDSTFATNGVLNYHNSGLNINFSEILYSSNGELFISGSAGNTTDSYFSLLKLLPDGTIDSVFANNGMFLNQVGMRWESNGAECMTVYKDDKVFLGGNSSDCDGGTCYFTSSMCRIITKLEEISDTTTSDTTHTSIEDFEKLGSNVVLFPNPLKKGEKLYIKSKAVVKNVKIYSLTGKELKTSLRNNSIQIQDITQPGIYIALVQTGDIQLHQKIIIQ